MLALRLAHRLIPQNSRDRLFWWHAVLQHLRERADRRRDQSLEGNRPGGTVERSEARRPEGG
ncbi:hypothetical protein KCH_14780 [Kitasatospora cheerisanensis KCTC 2395]|uniref:Uncharacterized protein n=1 Tax=Kitasatospora cheerisanensis KCTC 2395 TaxID=1348663 RepID=A0A066Z3E2_9ACTN|nr:hypothetical protein KCH_14780 [Kitasatospora cheerisanensis KCTC 2395]